MGRFLDRLPPWFTIALTFGGTIWVLALADRTLQSPLANHPPAAGHYAVAASQGLPAGHGRERRGVTPPMPTVSMPDLLPPTEGWPAELPLAEARSARREAAASFCPTSPAAAPVPLDAEGLQRPGDTGRLPAESVQTPAANGLGLIAAAAPCDDRPAPEPRPLVAARPVREAPLPPALHLPPAAAAEPPATDGSPADRVAETVSGSFRSDRLQPAERSWDLELVARQADEHTRRGCELASRKAVFSARLEFTRALRLIAQGLDAQDRTTEHSRALAAGLRAMTEAADFMPEGDRLEADLDVSTIARAHTTPVLHGADAGETPPLEALRRYFDYAQAQLAASVGSEVAGSVALQSLGKLYVVMADQPGEQVAAAGPKAMVCFQAALIAAPRNYVASNELGVLLARGGRYQEARAAFEHSVTAQPTAEAWRNLALTYERLGIDQAAYHAATQAMALKSRQQAPRQRLAAGGQAQVKWVDPVVFAGQNTGSAAAADGAPATAAQNAARPTESKIR